MRKLNLSFILLMLVSTLVLGGGLYLVHEFQMSRNSSAYVRAAKRAQAENRPEVAVAHLRRYVLLAPKDPEGLILFGFQLDDLSRPFNNLARSEQAYTILERALRVVPNRMDVRRRLVDLGMKLGRHSEVAEQITNYLLKESPNEGALYTDLSTCEYAQGHFVEAEKPLLDSIEKDPSHLRAYTMLASLRREKLNRPGDAVDAIDLMVSQNSNDAMAYFYRSQWLGERLAELKSSRKKLTSQETEQMLEQAIADVKQSLTLDPEYANAIMLAIHLSFEAGRIDDLKLYAEQGIKFHPEDHRFHLAMAELDKTFKGNDAAIETLKKGLTAAPGNPELKWALADILIEVGKIDDAVNLIKELRELNYQDDLVQFLDAKVLVYRQDWLPAIEQLELARVNLRDRPDLVKKVELWLGIGHRETLSQAQQLVSLRRAVAIDPGFTQARLELADTLLNANLLSEAISEYEQLLAAPNAPILAAIGLAKSLLRWNLSNPANWTEFDKIIRRMEGEESLKHQVALLKMEKHLAHDEMDEASKVVSEAREASPDQFDLWQAEISLSLFKEDWDRVETLFTNAQQQFGETAKLRLLKGRYLLKRHGAEALPQLKELAEVPAIWDEQQRMQLYSGLVALFMQAGDFDTAQRLGETVAEHEPRNLSIRLSLLDLAVQSKRTELMSKVLEEFRQIAGEKAFWYYGKALLLSLNTEGAESEQQVKADLNEALGNLKKAKTTAATWSRIPLLAGEIYERLSDTQSAADQYLESIRLGEREPKIFSRALSLLFRLGQFDAAERLIRELRESQVSFTEEMQRAEVDLALQLGRSKEALKATEELVRESKESLDPVWLGQVYATLGKYDQAASQFRSAIQMQKGDPKPWVGLVQVYTISGRKEKAESVIAEMKAALSGEDATLTVGLCYEMIGKSDMARATYQAAFDQSSGSLAIGHRLADFLMKSGANKDAETILRKLIKASAGVDKSKLEQRQFALRKLARVLMIMGGQDQLAEALSIVDRNLEADPNSNDDARLKAVILANAASSAQHHQAIAILEKLLLNDSTSATSADDRFLLARLYVQAGDRAKARNELKKLIASRKDDPRFYNAYAQLSLQSGEISEAELYLGVLQKLAPGDLSTVDLEAQVLFKKEKYADVIRLLKEIAASKGTSTSKIDSAATPKLWAAKSLEEFARRLEQAGKTTEAAQFADETETLYKQYIEERPEEMLVMAEFLAHTSEVDRALDLVQEHGQKSSPRRVASVAVAMMKNGQATPAQLSRLQSLLDQNAKIHTGSTLLSLISADLTSWRGQYQEALTAYKSILQRENNNVPALNNLAVLIALTGGDANEALGLIQRAIESGGPVNVLMDSRGIIQLAAGHPEKAITDFEGAVRQKETAERRFHVARAYLELKQYDSARQSLDRALQLSLAPHELHPLERPFLKELTRRLEENASKSVSSNSVRQ